MLVLKLWVQITIRVATLDANHSVTDSMQLITASTKKLPDSVDTSVSAARHGVSVSGKMIRLSV